MREKELQKWFKEHIVDGDKPYLLDKYQAKIVLDNHKNTLVTARAGSGKTRTIIAKIVFLLCHENIPSDKIIVFAFNKKARDEINERLTNISFDQQKLFQKPPALATTFHAFAYKIINQNNGRRLITEREEDKILTKILFDVVPGSKKLPRIELEKKIAIAKQFITKAEQKFFLDYDMLDQKINNRENSQQLQILNKILKKYHAKLERAKLINFNQLVAQAAEKMRYQKMKYEYIFVDEYQDFSLLFLNLIISLRKSYRETHLLCLGDDWQAINRFAGSDVEYFINFKKYFPEDCKKLFIPTNYRSGKKIVKNANYFMSKALKDYKGCKSGNKEKSRIYYRDVQTFNTNLKIPKMPLLLQNYLISILEIIKENPKKTIKILDRNNDLNFKGWSLEKFADFVREQAVFNNFLDEKAAKELITESTIHRSKGLEADIVILIEIDAEKFPGKSKDGELFCVFGENEQTLFMDEARLFYVALTRPKEKLFILSKTTRIIDEKEKKKYNFFHYLNDSWLEEW